MPWGTPRCPEQDSDLGQPDPERCLCSFRTELLPGEFPQLETCSSSSANTGGEACGPRRAPARGAGSCHQWPVFVHICATKYNEPLTASVQAEIWGPEKLHIQELVVDAQFPSCLSHFIDSFCAHSVVFCLINLWSACIQSFDLRAQGCADFHRPRGGSSQFLMQESNSPLLYLPLCKLLVIAHKRCQQV